MPCPTSGSCIAPLLISMAFGYGVLVLAKRETRGLSRLGKFMGWLIIAVSFIGTICIAAASLCRMCPVKGDRIKPAVMCPYGGPKNPMFPPESGEPKEMRK